NYARNVRAIQQMDVTLGRWVARHVPDDASVAVNDIGAIAYFGKHRVVDAIGLATPELTRYWSPLRLRTLIGLRQIGPKIGIFFPNWFPEWTSRPSLMRPLLQWHLDDKNVLGGATSVVYRLDWERFARYYDDARIEALDPPEVAKNLVSHLRRGKRNL